MRDVLLWHSFHEEDFDAGYATQRPLPMQSGVLRKPRIQLESSVGVGLSSHEQARPLPHTEQR